MGFYLSPPPSVLYLLCLIGAQRSPGLLLSFSSFFNVKSLNCFGALSFYDSKSGIEEVLFFYSILLS